MTTTSSADQLFVKVLAQGSLLIGLIATVGSVVGYFVDSQKGVPSALIGASLALVFTSLTLVSVLIGRRLSLAGFFGAVMGGWLVKLIGFAFLVGFWPGLIS